MFILSRFHGAKANDGERKKEKKERPKVGDKNGQATHGARKPPGPNHDYKFFNILNF